MKSENRIFFIFVLGLFLVIVGQPLFSDGMFMDGLWYATISKNLANGLGTFWYPHFTNTIFPAFHEHPPLAFGLQSLCFSIFGDGIYVERFYSLGTFFIVGLLIHFIWKEWSGSSKFSWIPLLLWVCIPTVSWTFANNMLENTMGIFLCLSVWFYLRSLKANRWFYLFVSGLMLILGALSKGFVALFPWSFPFFLWIVSRQISFRRMFTDTGMLVGCTLLPFIILLMSSTEAYDSLHRYFIQQVVGSIENVQTVENRFYILRKSFEELIPCFSILLITYFIGRNKKLDATVLKGSMKKALPLFLLALSGVAPMMISMKQRSFYISATYPFFAISLGIFIFPIVKPLFKNLKYSGKGFKIFKVTAYLFLLTGIGLSFAQRGRIGRNRGVVEDVHTILKYVPEGSIIGICPKLRNEWGPHGYFNRYGGISLAPDVQRMYSFFLSKKGCINEKEIVKEYNKIPISLKVYNLYKLK